MSHATEQRRKSLQLELPSRDGEDRPPLAAAFLALFHLKTGYKIAWKRSIPGFELSESIEYKALPSGLHNVEEDIVYFTQDNEYAGISAFVRKSSDGLERNATMLSVGVLVHNQNRLGKSWKYAETLRDLATKLSNDVSDTQQLEKFWEENKPSSDTDEAGDQSSKDVSVSTPSKNKSTRSRDRAVSSASLLTPVAPSLSPHHPALSLDAFLKTFGPLIFPLYKAALLRKRVLLLGRPPVETTCNYVYDISLLSGLPSSIVDSLPLEPLPIRLHPLYIIGIHDIEAISTKESSQTDAGNIYGWAACTTDDILSYKTDIYDFIVHVPPPHNERAKQKVWPRIMSNTGREIKATQRDLRRYRILRRELHDRSADDSGLRQLSSLDLSRSLTELNQESCDIDSSSTLDADLAESQSWSALAYNSFMWWASAGEKRTDLDEENEHDVALLRSSENGAISPGRPRSSSAQSPSGIPISDQRPSTSLETFLVAYFHRFTTQILRTLADVVEDADFDGARSEVESNANSLIETDDLPASSNDEREEARLLQDGQSDKESGSDSVVLVEAEDMTRMGLDSWSPADKEFVTELIALYWGRKADVRGGRVECCGMRII